MPCGRANRPSPHEPSQGAAAIEDRHRMLAAIEDKHAISRIGRHGRDFVQLHPAGSLPHGSRPRSRNRGRTCRRSSRRMTQCLLVAWLGHSQFVRLRQLLVGQLRQQPGNRRRRKEQKTRHRAGHHGNRRLARTARRRPSPARRRCGRSCSKSRPRSFATAWGTVAADTS